MSRRLLPLALVAGLLVSLGMVAGVQADSVCADPCGIPSTDILAYPAPNVQQLYPDDQQLYDRHYEKVLNAVSIYDAPNGNVVDSLAAGFNYVTVKGSTDGWTE